MNEIEKACLHIYVRLMAVQAGLIAILRVSNNPELAEVLAKELEKARSVLMGNPIPDECLESFEQQLVAIQKAVE